MRFCGIKKIRASDYSGVITVLVSILCGFAFVFFISYGPDISLTHAQEKKSGLKKDAKTVRGAPTVASIEEERLKILNADLTAKIDELKKLKAEIETLMKGVDAKKKEQLMKVVKMYEAMPAEEAAKALGKLDDDTAVQILTSLKARSAGQILGQMDSDRVAVLSKKAIFRGRFSKEKSAR